MRTCALARRVPDSCVQGPLSRLCARQSLHACLCPCFLSASSCQALPERELICVHMSNSAEACEHVHSDLETSCFPQQVRHSIPVLPAFVLLSHVSVTLPHVCGLGVHTWLMHWTISTSSSLLPCLPASMQLFLSSVQRDHVQAKPIHVWAPSAKMIGSLLRKLICTTARACTRQGGPASTNSDRHVDRWTDSWLERRCNPAFGRAGKRKTTTPWEETCNCGALAHAKAHEVTLDKQPQANS